MTIEISATQFCHQRGAFLDQALAGDTIVVKRHARPIAVILSYDEFLKMTPKVEPSLEKEQKALLQRLRKQLSQHQKAGYSVVDEFLAEKRREAEKE